jgi:hypothetical protein
MEETCRITVKKKWIIDGGKVRNRKVTASESTFQALGTACISICRRLER